MKKFWAVVVVIFLLGGGLWLYTRLSPSKPTLTDVDGDSALARIAEANGALEDLDMIIGDRKATGFSVAEPIYRSLPTANRPRPVEKGYFYDFHHRANKLSQPAHPSQSRQARRAS